MKCTKQTSYGVWGRVHRKIGPSETISDAILAVAAMSHDNI